MRTVNAESVAENCIMNYEGRSLNGERISWIRMGVGKRSSKDEGSMVGLRKKE